MRIRASLVARQAFAGNPRNQMRRKPFGSMWSRKRWMNSSALSVITSQLLLAFPTQGGRAILEASRAVADRDAMGVAAEIVELQSACGTHRAL